MLGRSVCKVGPATNFRFQCTFQLAAMSAAALACMPNAVASRLSGWLCVLRFYLGLLACISGRRGAFAHDVTCPPISLPAQWVGVRHARLSCPAVCRRRAVVFWAASRPSMLINPTSCKASLPGALLQPPRSLGILGDP